MIVTVCKLDESILENPRHTRDFADDVSDDEADRDHDDRRYAKFEEGAKIHSHRRIGKIECVAKNDDDWAVNNVDCITLLGQEAA